MQTMYIVGKLTVHWRVESDLIVKTSIIGKVSFWSIPHPVKAKECGKERLKPEK